MPIVGKLTGLLHTAPVLKYLTIEVVIEDLEDYIDDFDYVKMKCIPSCFINSLESVVFDGYQWKSPQFHLAKFILQNGIELEEVSFYCCDDDGGGGGVDGADMLKLKEEMSSFTRARVLVHV